MNAEAGVNEFRKALWMRSRTHIPTANSWSILLRAVLLAAVAAVTLLPYSAANAQTATPTPGPTHTATPTSTASTLSAPILTATAAGAAAIDLNWTAVPGAARYALFTQLAAEPGWHQLDEGNLTATSYPHRNLTPGATYQYAVRAFDAHDQPLGPWSNFPTATAPGSGSATLTATATPTPTVATTERDALIALYDATDGANWKNSDNWLTDKPLGSWYGVSTDGGGNVTELDLSRNDLNGLVPDLSALTNLMKLNLSYNRLRRNISGLSRLTNLTELDVSNNLLAEGPPEPEHASAT